MADLSSGHPWTMTLYSAASARPCARPVHVCSRKWFSVLSSSLGFLQFCSDSISIRKTSKCATLADIGCGRAARDRVSARWRVGPLFYVRSNRYRCSFISILSRRAGALFNGFFIMVWRG